MRDWEINFIYCLPTGSYIAIMKLTFYIVLLLCLVFIDLGTCYNILVIFAQPVKSRYDVFEPLFQELGERGHNITTISHLSSIQKRHIKNGKDVILSKQPTKHIFDVNSYAGTRFQKYIQVKSLSDSASKSCQFSLESDSFQVFLKQDHQFDVILVDFFNSNCFHGLIRKLEAPFIGLSPSAMMPWQVQWFGTPENPSYIPSLFMAHPVPMTFFQRVENAVVHFAHKAWYKIFMENPGTALSRKYIGYDPVDPYNASLFLVNIHHTLHGARPLSPSLVEVGGIHVANRKPQKLPKEMEEWTKAAKDGLIYFSLGSLLKGYTFPSDKLEVFNRVFSELPYRVLWKWENETMTDKPDNVMTSKWAPQFDILCHPNTRLFISHGGLLGTTEAVHCGVPVLMMPQYGDQPLNAEALKTQGTAVILKLKDVTYETVKEALTKSLHPEIQEKAKELSSRFRDRLVPPLDTAVYWVEHVARYKGAPHMRSAAVDMPFYQYLLLDVIGFLLGSVLVFIYFVYLSARYVCGRSRQKVKKN